MAAKDNGDVSSLHELDSFWISSIPCSSVQGRNSLELLSDN